jgi:periplasmic protein CpxP/Spy
VYKRFLAVAGSGLLILGLGLTTAKAQDQTSNPPDNAPQGPPPPGRGMRGGMNPDQMLARLDQRLHLSDDQKTKIRSILEDQHAAMEKLRSDSSLAPEDRRAKMQSLMAEHHDQIKNVLNDQQKQQFDQMMERRGRMGGGNPPPPGGQAPPDSQTPPPQSQ